MSLEGFRISRCFKPESFGKAVRAELHHFADASQEHGYGKASYLRLINDNGKIHSSFVLGKSRLRPLKNAVTVSMLELTAATLATRINKVVTKELEGRLRIDSVTYWTDSMIVLKYIANETRRFVTFVANRVAIIRQESEPGQWRHVRSGHNTADYASRGIKASEIKKLEKWKMEQNSRGETKKNGLHSLQKLQKNFWIATKELKDRRSQWEQLSYKRIFGTPCFNCRYSRWDRMRRIVAWLIRVFHRAKHPKPQVKRNRSSKAEFKFSPVPLSVSEVTEAEKTIARFVQKQSFPMKIDKPAIAGQLARLKPFEEEGILRVGGRLKHSDLQYDANISTQ